MQNKLLAIIGILFLSQAVLSQEIGSVMNGTYSVAIVKSNDLYAFTYSDINSSDEINLLKSFNFTNKETIYNIIADGFKNESNHQVYVQIDKITIIKFDYKTIRGVMMLKIRHNNLNTNTLGESFYLTEGQILKLFKESSLTKA